MWYGSGIFSFGTFSNDGQKYISENKNKFSYCPAPPNSVLSHRREVKPVKYELAEMRPPWHADSFTLAHASRASC